MQCSQTMDHTSVSYYVHIVTLSPLSRDSFLSLFRWIYLSFTMNVIWFFVKLAATIMAWSFDIKSIVNLYTYQLANAHMSVFQKDLKFCPTPGHPNPGVLRSDFDLSTQIAMADSVFWQPGEWYHSPLANSLMLPTALDLGDNLVLSNTYYTSYLLQERALLDLNIWSPCNEQQCSTHPTFWMMCHSSVTLSELSVIKVLKSNENIIIKPADRDLQ